MKNYIAVSFTCIVFAACLTGPPMKDTQTLPAVDNSAFIFNDGRLLKDPNGNDFLIKGIAFGNSVWGNPSSANDFTHHQMSDYANVKSMGFNSVRFYINYGLFEDDSRPYKYKDSGFDWLDENIIAAKEAGIYLVLNMHAPQGGFQSIGDGDALWNDKSNQKRLIALWQELALRYRDEPQIIGFGLVNEPVPVKGLNQWKTLAQDIVDAIRKVDRHHLLFIERAIWVKSETTKREKQNMLFPLGISDPAGKMVFEYHMYDPMSFTHQGASWTGWKNIVSSYPDPTHIEIKNRRWAGFTQNNSPLPAGSFDWTFYEGEKFLVNNSEYLVAAPVFQVQSIGKKGRVWVDDISVEEFDTDGNSLGIIWSSSVNDDSGWWFWAANGKGKFGVSDYGRSGGKSLTISGTTGDANITAGEMFIKVTQGHAYRINGNVRGENIDNKAVVRLRMDFYSGDSINTWDGAYLESLLQDYFEISKQYNVPLYLGEFGVINYAFEDNRGGTLWIEDMLSLMNEYKVNYNYHTYHEPAFGIYQNRDGYPDPAMANDSAIAVFKKLQIP